MRLIDADVLCNKLNNETMLETYNDFKQVNETIMNAPTIDAVPVVRCKDCKYYKSPVVTRDSGICAFANRDELTEPANYCSRGAKMEVEHDNA